MSESTHNPCNTNQTARFRIFAAVTILIFCTFAVKGQVTNGNFETLAGPDLTGWAWTCGGQSWQDAPQDGGNWCIKVHSGNTQGCFPGYAYQRLSNIVPGQSYILSGWAKAESSPVVGLYFGKISNGVITLQSGDTTSSTAWELLQLTSSFQLGVGDTPVVVLWGGLTGGPLQGYGFFDLVDICSCIGVEDVPDPAGITLFPNPMTESALLGSESGFRNATITLQDALMHEVTEMRQVNGSTLTIHRDDLPAGIYFIRISENQQVRKTLRLVVL